jgi:hypothetical protein
LRIYQKTLNKSRNVSNVTILFIGINLEIMKLSADMHLITEYLVWEEIFAIYQMGTHGFSIFKCNALIVHKWRVFKENHAFKVKYQDRNGVYGNSQNVISIKYITNYRKELFELWNALVDFNLFFENFPSCLGNIHKWCHAIVTFPPTLTIFSNNLWHEYELCT